VLSLIIPVYKNEANLDRLLAALAELSRKLEGDLEAVFVIDGSPDRCLEILRERLPVAPMQSRLLSLSRNFGSFAAITAGLKVGTGEYLAVLAADLQEPPELVLQFWNILRNDEADIVFGYRTGRADPWLSELFSNLFWDVYRLLVVRNMPKGGIDVFGCTRQVRDRLVEFPEASTNLIALLFWLGFRRRFVGYARLARQEGKSAWTFAKKVRYCFDSIFNFTDLPIRLLLFAGLAGVSFSVLCSIVVLIAKVLGDIPVPGYTPILLAILLFGGFTSLGFGITGEYLWLTLQNSRRRPGFVVASREEYGPEREAKIVGEYGGRARSSI
jgi:glycosyltransferase involved in cell wall biosynthesis